MRKTIVMLSAGILAGCATKPPPSEADVAEAYAPLVCVGAQQCTEWWRRSQVWVANNSGFKIQILSDAIIETYNPPNYSLRWAFSVTREPIGEGKEQIKIAPNCGPVPICQDYPQTLMAKFKRYVKGDAT